MHGMHGSQIADKGGEPPPRRTPLCQRTTFGASHTNTMARRNLVFLLALFFALFAFVAQTAAVPATGAAAEAEALENEDGAEGDEDDSVEDEIAEAREEFESIDKNGDGFLERDEIMAMEEVRAAFSAPHTC